MDSANIQNKMKMFLEKITEPDYVLNNYYADSLINKLSCNSDSESVALGKLPVLTDLLIAAFDKPDSFHISVKVFMVRLLAVIARDELNFTKIFYKKSDEVAKAFSQLNSTDVNPSLRVSYMEVSLSIASHPSGIVWLLSSGVWKNILCMCNVKQTVFVIRQTYKFANKFLWKLEEMNDETSIKEVLDLILTPLRTRNYCEIKTMSSEEEEEHLKTLEPMVHMLLSLLNDGSKLYTPSLVIKNILLHYRVASHLNIIMDFIHKDDVTVLLAKCIFYLVIAKVFLNKPIANETVYKETDFMDLTVTYFNLVQYFIRRRSATSVLDFCNVCNIIWNQIDKANKVPIQANSQGKEILIHQQLLFIPLIPILVYIKDKRKNPSQWTDERIQLFIMKLLNSSCQHTARSAYAMRDLIVELDTLSVTLHSVKRLACLNNHLNNTQANLIFQALYYVLRDYDPTDDHGDMREEDTLEESKEKVLVMTYVMETILLLVKNYNINWQESLETLCLYSMVHNILKKPNLSCKFVVTALNLLALTVKKFLPPNLNLLLETRPGIAIHELGQLIYQKLHDLSWEVRDSALELLLVCTEISYCKFPPFQKQILENKLINVAATIAMNDHESYVQASALKCLGPASRMAGMWDQLLLQYPNLLDQLLVMLCNNQEGIVRKEIVAVLSDLFQNLRLQPAYKQSLYEHMVSTALSDFHWEVQIAALKFWKIIIQSFLADQGMLDGTFPPVTFSKETRKIVTLNHAEIQKRLVKMLEELASIGCLSVLVKLIQDESEIEIMDASLTIALELLDILKVHKVVDILKQMNISEESLNLTVCEYENEHNVESVNQGNEEDKSEKVIESIINADDINLLSNIYEREMKLDKAKKEIKPKIKLLKYASPSLFVSFLVSKDFKACIEQKRQWNDGIRSVSSLIDDILGIYEVNDDEVNTMDCY